MSFYFKKVTIKNQPNVNIDSKLASLTSLAPVNCA